MSLFEIIIILIELQRLEFDKITAFGTIVGALVVIGLFANFSRWLYSKIQDYRKESAEKRQRDMDERDRKIRECNSLIKAIDKNIEENIKTLKFEKTVELSGGWGKGISDSTDKLFKKYYDICEEGKEYRKLAERDLELAALDFSLKEYLKKTMKELGENEVKHQLKNTLIPRVLLEQKVDAYWLQSNYPKYVDWLEPTLKKKRENLHKFFKDFNQRCSVESSLKLLWGVRDKLIGLAEELKEELKRVRDELEKEK